MVPVDIETVNCYTSPEEVEEDSIPDMDPLVKKRINEIRRLATGRIKD
jgi:hypothetical protein